MMEWNNPMDKILKLKEQWMSECKKPENWYIEKYLNKVGQALLIEI